MATVNLEPQPPEAPRPADPTVGRLVGDALADLSGLIRGEIALAKGEITADLKKGGVGAGMLAAAGVVALLGVVFLLHTIARAIGAVLPVWVGYLIVTLVLFAVAAVLALMGKRAMAKVKGKPARTIATTKSTIDTVKRSASGEITNNIRRTDPVSHGPSRSEAPAETVSSAATVLPRTPEVAPVAEGGSHRA